MKTIEEKAKRYDEAIEIARKIKNGEPINVPNGTVIPDIIFPELKEDENDRIRRVIIEHFVSSHSCMFPYKGFTKEQIIDWLEKQGEQKPYERKDFISIPFGTDSELIEETITIPDGYCVTIEGRKICIKKK